MDLLSLLAAIATIGGLASALAELIGFRFRLRREEETTEQRISRLTSSLREATELIGQIEREIEERQSLAVKLQSDIETYNRLVELKQSEVEAVAQLLRGELHRERRRSFWENAALNFFFFVLGVIVTIVLTGRL
jgi:peptidoglycan hydrolase CwlO-like protein